MRIPSTRLTPSQMPSSVATGAVCVLDEWLAEETMQAIAAENNLSETAFLVADGDGYGNSLVYADGRDRPGGTSDLAAGSLVLTRLIRIATG